MTTLEAHLRAVQPPLSEEDLPTALADCERAIAAVAEGRPDEVVWYEEGEPAIYAHHLVSIFSLERWVEDMTVSNAENGTVTLDKPWWVIEGFVIGRGTYTVVGVDGTTKIVATTLGAARLLEEAPGMKPTAFSASL